MMDSVMDFLFEVILQVIFEVVVQLGLHGAARVLKSRLGRSVVAASAGFAFGVWWGAHLADAGTGHRPRLFWVSIALAGTALLVLAIRRQQSNRELQPDEPVTVLPWRWPPHRLVSFAVLNVAIAVGIAVGFTPGVPG
jgi:hypothetical protein